MAQIDYSKWDNLSTGSEDDNGPKAKERAQQATFELADECEQSKELADHLFSLVHTKGGGEEEGNGSYHRAAEEYEKVLGTIAENLRKTVADSRAPRGLLDRLLALDLSCRLNLMVCKFYKPNPDLREIVNSHFEILKKHKLRATHEQVVRLKYFTANALLRINDLDSLKQATKMIQEMKELLSKHVIVTDKEQKQEYLQLFRDIDSSYLRLMVSSDKALHESDIREFHVVGWSKLSNQAASREQLLTAVAWFTQRISQTSKVSAASNEIRKKLLHDLYLGLTKAHEYLKDPQKSYQCLSKAAEYADDDLKKAKLYVESGSAYANKLSKMDLALHEYKLASLALENVTRNNEAIALKALALAGIGSAHLALKDLEGTVDPCQSAIELIEGLLLQYQRKEVPLKAATAFTPDAFQDIMLLTRHLLNTHETLATAYDKLDLVEKSLTTLDDLLDWTDHIIVWLRALMATTNAIKDPVKVKGLKDRLSAQETTVLKRRAAAFLFEARLLANSLSHRPENESSESGNGASTIHDTAEVLHQAIDIFQTLGDSRQQLATREWLMELWLRHAQIRPFYFSGSVDLKAVRSAETEAEKVSSMANLIADKIHAARNLRQVADTPAISAQQSSVELQQEIALRNKAMVSMFQVGLCATQRSATDGVKALTECIAMLPKFEEALRLLMEGAPTSEVVLQESKDAQRHLFRSDAQLHLAYAIYKTGRNIDEALGHCQSSLKHYEEIQDKKRQKHAWTLLAFMWDIVDDEQQMATAVDKVGSFCIGPVEDFEKETMQLLERIAQARSQRDKEKSDDASGNDETSADKQERTKPVQPGHQQALNGNKSSSKAEAKGTWYLFTVSRFSLFMIAVAIIAILTAYFLALPQ